MRTQAVEDYLKTIYEAGRGDEPVSTSEIAERLEVAPASATGMVKKLDEMNLIEYERYKGVTLTEAGRKMALEVIRHHRLVELYLHEALHVPWDRVHEEAEKLEHVLSDYVEDRMDASLGHPTHDPHGAPIPTPEGEVEVDEYVCLADCTAGDCGVVAEVNDDDPELLRYLGDLSLYPDSEIEVVEVAPFQGPLTIRMGESEETIGREAARHVFLRSVRPGERDGGEENGSADG